MKLDYLIFQRLDDIQCLVFFCISPSLRKQLLAALIMWLYCTIYACSRQIGTTGLYITFYLVQVKLLCMCSCRSSSLLPNLPLSTLLHIPCPGSGLCKPVVWGSGSSAFGWSCESTRSACGHYQTKISTLLHQLVLTQKE